MALSSFRGKEVLLDFRVSWCGPCNLEMPDTITVYREYRSRGFEIVAVSIAETPERVSAFVERHDVPFPVVLDHSGAVGQACFVRALPASIFLNREGIIEAIHVGALTEGMLRQYLSRLVDLSCSSKPSRGLERIALVSRIPTRGRVFPMWLYRFASGAGRGFLSG